MRSTITATHALAKKHQCAMPLSLQSNTSGARIGVKRPRVDSDLLATVLRVHMQSKLHKVQNQRHQSNLVDATTTKIAMKAGSSCSPRSFQVLKSTTQLVNEPQVQAHLSSDRANYGFDAALATALREAQHHQQQHQPWVRK